MRITGKINGSKSRVRSNTEVFNELIEGFQLIGFDWRYLYVNNSVVKQSKCKSKEELIGFTMMEKFPGIEHTEMFAGLQKCMNARISVNIENEFVFPDGSSNWFELRVQPVEEGLFILSMDITERKNMMLLLEQQVAERTEETIRQKEIIEEKNQCITDSILYASKIQEALLPPKEALRSVFPNSFVIYQPKDIIGGDFYYLNRTSASVVLAVADCTGHGVPGALMSMLGVEILSSALQQSTDPSEILEYLNRGIKKSLGQTGNEIASRDGLDILLCAVDLHSRVVRFAGANRPIWIITKNGDEVLDLKTTKTAIGGYTPYNQRFETSEIQLNEGDTFYMFSDGYGDLFSGTNTLLNDGSLGIGKKLTTKRFKEVLMNIKGLTMQEQKNFLNDFANQWRAGMEQTDDILVVGIRL